MCRCVEEREGPLAAGRSFAFSASPPGRVELRICGTGGGSGGGARNVPEYLQRQDSKTFCRADTITRGCRLDADSSTRYHIDSYLRCALGRRLRGWK